MVVNKKNQSQQMGFGQWRVSVTVAVEYPHCTMVQAAPLPRIYVPFSYS
jgi:hypothetical protein